MVPFGPTPLGMEFAHLRWVRSEPTADHRKDGSTLGSLLIPRACCQSRLAEGVGEHGDQLRHLAQVDPSGGHANVVPPMAKDERSLIRVPRRSQACAGASAVRNPKMLAGSFSHSSRIPPAETSVELPGQPRLLRGCRVTMGATVRALDAPRRGGPGDWSGSGPRTGLGSDADRVNRADRRTGTRTTRSHLAAARHGGERTHVGPSGLCPSALPVNIRTHGVLSGPQPVLHLPHLALSIGDADRVPPRRGRRAPGRRLGRFTNRRDDPGHLPRATRHLRRGGRRERL